MHDPSSATGPHDRPATGEHTLARLLSRAQRNGSTIAAVATPWRPPDAASAYRVQHETLALRGERIGGWKVGAKSPAGPVQGAPLPAGALHPSGAVLPRRTSGTCALELEIGFRFGRSLPAGDTAPDADAVLAAVDGVVATIELVSSRLAHWPEVDRLLQLADLQNHGALVVSDAVPYDPGLPFLAPALRFDFDGDSVLKAPAANPAGDPRRLLPWLAGHAAAMGRPLQAGDVVTTGSYTGLFFPDRPGTAVGTIEGLPPVVLRLA